MEHTDPTAYRAPLNESEAAAEAQRIIAAAYQPTPDPMMPTAYRDTSPVPAIGTTPPVNQPGARPPMSQKATDISGLMVASGIASLPIGGATSLVLYTLGHVDPTALAIGAAAPVAFVLAVGSLLRSAGRAKRDMHTEHHHHYQGPVTVTQNHHTESTHNRGMFSGTRNKTRG